MNKGQVTHRFNPHKLLNREKVWLMTHYCKHSHTYMEHPKCFYEDYGSGKIPDCPIIERMGYLDIETSNIHAPFGFMLSWCIKENGGKIVGDYLREREFKKERNSQLSSPVKIDERILKSLSKEMIKYDKLVVYWGKNRRHDVPYTRHRMLKLGIQFPLYGTVYCVDLYDWARNMVKMPYGRYSLWSICNEFDVPAKTTRCPMYFWAKAKTGNMKALKVIYQHNKEDVISLEPLYHMFNPFARKMRTSI